MPTNCSVCGQLSNTSVCSDCLRKQQMQRADVFRSLTARLGGIRAVKEYMPGLFCNKKLFDEVDAVYPAQDLLLYGQPGTGKTHLGVAVGRVYLDFYVVKMPQMVRQFREAEQQGEWKVRKLLDFYSTKKIMFDDVEEFKQTAYAQGIFYEIQDLRWQNYVSGQIWTSNKGRTALSEIFGEKIISRLSANLRVFNVLGPDYRQPENRVQLNGLAGRSK